MTNLYNKYLLPGITHVVCSARPNMKQREKIVPLANGRVLEIGAGSGLNLRYYAPDKVECLYALDPSEEMWAIARKSLRTNPVEVQFIKGYADKIAVDDHSVDTIVTTYTLCSIADLNATFAELRRILRPGGILLFCEHGIAPDRSIRRWQNFINPLWKRLGGGCHLNRNIPELLKTGGFHPERLETMYIPGWKPLSYNYWGVARLT